MARRNVRFAMTVIVPVARRECLQIAQEIAQTASILAPKDTGRLSQSYEAKPTPDGAIVTSTAPYWKFVEFGTKYMTARRHVRPAVEEVRAVHL